MRAPEARAKILNILQESSIFMHLKENAAQIVDLFARLGGAGACSSIQQLEARSVRESPAM